MRLELKQLVARAKYSGMREAEFTNPSAFNAWFFTLVFNILFIIMHVSNFPQQRNYDLYLFLIFGLNMPWTLSCVRNYIVVPQTRRQEYFVLVFDIICTKPFIRNALILQLFSIQGFFNAEYFSLMLLDIINTSDKLMQIVKSVSRRADSLLLIFVLYLFTVVIFVSFGLVAFEDYFAKTVNEDTFRFKSVLSGFWFFLDKMSSRGESAMAPVVPKSEDYISRVVSIYLDSQPASQLASLPAC